MSKSEITILIYLGVKGIAFQLILALERPGVSLVHSQFILIALEDFDFIHHVQT